jgi:hypothetical protein
MVDHQIFSTRKPRPYKGEEEARYLNYYLWLARPISENGKPKSWEFSTDARGRSYKGGEDVNPGVLIDDAAGLLRLPTNSHRPSRISPLTDSGRSAQSSPFRLLAAQTK